MKLCTNRSLHNIQINDISEGHGIVLGKGTSFDAKAEFVACKLKGEHIIPTIPSQIYQLWYLHSCDALIHISIIPMHAAVCLLCVIDMFLFSSACMCDASLRHLAVTVIQWAIGATTIWSFVNKHLLAACLGGPGQHSLSVYTNLHFNYARLVTANIMNIST